MVNISLAKTFVKLSSGLLGLVAALVIAVAPTALAQPTSGSTSTTNNDQSQSNQSTTNQNQDTTNTDGEITTIADGSEVSQDTAQEEQKQFNTGGEGTCAGEKVDFFACDGDGAEAIASIFTQIMMVMSIGVGIVATGFLTYAGIMYASAQDNREQVQKSIGIVRNVVVGILLYVFMISIIDWLIPGGIFDQPAEDTNQSQNADSQDGTSNQEETVTPDEEAGTNTDQTNSQAGN